MDIARSIQMATEDVALRLARTIQKEQGTRYLCIVGGVALNCIANGRILREGPFEDIWVQPAAGDVGGALGAALAAWYEYKDMPRWANGSDYPTGAGGSGTAFRCKQSREHCARIGGAHEDLSD